MVDVAAAGAGDASKDPNLIPPPPPTIPPNVKPGVLTSPKYSITSRKQLLANHFKVTVKAPDSVFYQYSVCLPRAVTLSVRIGYRFILLLKTKRPLKARELAENWLTGSIKHILLNLLITSLCMIKRKLYIQLVLSRKTSLTLQFPWRRHLQREKCMPCITSIMDFNFVQAPGCHQQLYSTLQCHKRTSARLFQQTALQLTVCYCRHSRGKTKNSKKKSRKLRLCLEHQC